jgi:Asp-tRNA(Asn)/Glu-tRNA(Gln) amidotransferase C subunit
MALSSIWITVVSILATFDITKAVDENGNVIEPSYDYLSGLIRSVMSFFRAEVVLIPSSVHHFLSNVPSRHDRKRQLPLFREQPRVLSVFS